MRDTRYVYMLKLDIVSTGILSVGGNDRELLLDSYSGKPLLPASGIAGAIHNYLYQCGVEEKKLRELFGYINRKKEEEDSEGADAHKKSHLFIRDAEAKEFAGEYELRSGVRIDPKTGTADDTGKFEVKALAKGIAFELEFTAEAENMEQLKSFRSMLHMAVTAMQMKLIRFGAHKTNGAGTVEVTKIREAELDLYDPTQYCQYLTGQVKYTRKTVEELQADAAENRMIRIEVEAASDSPFLIGGIDENREDEADKVSVKNQAGEYIIPGSSLKGILRGQCRRIADFTGKPESMVQEMFGGPREKEGISADKKVDNSAGYAGRVFAADAECRNVKDGVMYHRIAIDKFTGGTGHGRKFSTRPVQGMMTLDLAVQSRRGQDSAELEAQAGLLLLAVRDLISGRVTIGGGFNVGYGHLMGDKICVTDGNKKIQVSLSQRTTGAIDPYIQAYLNYEGGGAE